MDTKDYIELPITLRVDRIGNWVALFGAVSSDAWSSPTHALEDLISRLALYNYDAAAEWMIGYSK